MTSPPAFRYFVGEVEVSASSGDPLWETPLPMDRHHFQDSDTSPPHYTGITHGDYFSAARRFLEKDGFDIISSAFAPGLSGDAPNIHICLMKHGEFYHPARILVSSDGRQRTFVLNVAVSESGRRIIDTEISSLKRLGKISKRSLIPRVYGQGCVAVRHDLDAEMFLGEWFEGYQEFHLSRNVSGKARKLCLWRENDTPYFLTSEDSGLLYHAVAKILTVYYNMATTEHISRWHHASGDFVVKHEANRLSVKLVTVRAYGPLLQMEEEALNPRYNCDQATAALLIFFLNLSIRMRLDRIDGIGDFVWADETAVTGAWTGFLDGLANNFFPSQWLSEPITQLKNYLATFSVSELFDLAETLAASLPALPAEKAIIEKHLGNHMAALCDTISTIGFPDI